MADYYSIVARAVGALEPNTGDARRRLYERARRALVAEMSSAALALDPTDINAARNSLEEAIAEVEAEARRDERSRRAAAPPPPADLPLDDIITAPGPPANQNGKHRRGRLTRLWTQVFRRAGESINNIRRDVPPVDHGETLFSHFPDPAHSGKGRDTWLTDLLARASRDEEEAEDQDFAPPRKIGRG
jgi:hypothetical protein